MHFNAQPLQLLFELLDPCANTRILRVHGNHVGIVFKGRTLRILRVQSLFVHTHRISHTKTALSLTSISSGSIAISAGALHVISKSSLPTEQLVGEYRCSSPQL